MSVWCNGSIMVSKTMGIGSSPMADANMRREGCIYEMGYSGSSLIDLTP